MKNAWPIENIDLRKLGEVIKMRRKEKGWTQSQLAQKIHRNISLISNIENGLVGNHEEDIQKICSALEIQLDQLDSFDLEKQKKDEKIKFLLVSIESKIDLAENGPDLGLKALNELSLEKNDLYYSYWLFLKGKALYKKGKIDKALNTLLEALKMLNDKPELDHLDLKPKVCNYIGICFYRKNKLRQAIIYIDEGLNQFSTFYFPMLINKAVYLEKLDCDEQAMKIISEIWPQKEKIDITHSLLNLYVTYCSLAKKFKMYSQAIDIAMEGIDIARRNLAYDHAFELWIKLGNIYYQLGSYEEAESCYFTALDLKGKVKTKRLLTEAYTKLGTLCTHQKRFEDAKSFFLQSVQIGEQTDDALRLIEALIELSKLLYIQGEYNEALEYLNHALLIAQEHELKNQQKTIWFIKAKCYEKKNEMDQVQQCLMEKFQLEKEGDMP